MPHLRIVSRPQLATYLLLGHLLGQGDDHTISLDGSSERQTNTW